MGWEPMVKCLDLTIPITKEENLQAFIFRDLETLMRRQKQKITKEDLDIRAERKVPQREEPGGVADDLTGVNAGGDIANLEFEIGYRRRFRVQDHAIYVDQLE